MKPIFQGLHLFKNVRFPQRKLCTNSITQVNSLSESKCVCYLIKKFRNKSFFLFCPTDLSVKRSKKWFDKKATKLNKRFFIGEGGKRHPKNISFKSR